MPEGRAVCAQQGSAGNDCGICTGAGANGPGKPQRTHPKKLNFSNAPRALQLPSLQMFVVPVHDAVQAIHQMFFFAQTVGLARINNEFRLHAIAL